MLKGLMETTPVNTRDVKDVMRCVVLLLIKRAKVLKVSEATVIH
jgi:hypothetical protein